MWPKADSYNREKIFFLANERHSLPIVDLKLIYLYCRLLVLSFIISDRLSVYLYKTLLTDSMFAERISQNKKNGANLIEEKKKRAIERERERAIERERESDRERERENVERQQEK